MNAKAWNAGEIRKIARQTIEGREVVITARCTYLRALLETTQAELGGNAGQAAQLTALRAVHRRFYPVVQSAIATDELILAAGFAKKKVAVERNRRLNFARSDYGTIRRWLRVDGHDLMKLEASKATKSALLDDSAPIRRHKLTPERAQVRARKLLDGLLVFTRELAGTDREQAARVLREALEKLEKVLVEMVAVAHVPPKRSAVTVPLYTARTKEISQRRAI